MGNENVIAIYQKIENPMREAADDKWMQAVSSYTGCSLQQAPAIMLTCILEGMTPKDYARTYYPMMGKSVMKTNAMLANFRTKFGGKHVVVTNNADLAEVHLIDKDGAKHEQKFTLEEAIESRFPWNDFERAHATVAEFRAVNPLATWCEIMTHMRTVKYKYNGKDNAALKDNWTAPTDWANMLWMRCVSIAVDRFCPEVDSGAASLDEALTLNVADVQVTTNKPPKAATLEPKTKAPRISKVVEPVAAAAAADDDVGVEDAQFEPSTAATAAESSTVAAPSGDVPQGDGFISASRIAYLKGLIETCKVPNDDLEKMLSRRNAKVIRNLTVTHADDLIQRLEQVVRNQEADIPFPTTPAQS